MTEPKTESRLGHKINLRYEREFPRNCPVLEYTADWHCVGTCTFYLPDGKTCPRHGVVKLEAARD